jgi:hypothetical protein
MTELTTHTLEVPGAVLTYDVRRNGASTEPPLMLIGEPMGAAGFGTAGDDPALHGSAHGHPCGRVVLTPGLRRVGGGRRTRPARPPCGGSRLPGPGSRNPDVVPSERSPAGLASVPRGGMCRAARGTDGFDPDVVQLSGPNSASYSGSAEKAFRKIFRSRRRPVCDVGQVHTDCFFQSESVPSETCPALSSRRDCEPAAFLDPPAHRQGGQTRW